MAVSSAAWWNMVFHAPTPPYIGQQPASQTTMAGAILRFTPDTYGTPTLQHAWRHDGVELADGGVVQGAHMQNLTIDPVAVPDSGDYDLTISNPQGTLTTDIAHATIL